MATYPSVYIFVCVLSLLLLYHEALVGFSSIIIRLDSELLPIFGFLEIDSWNEERLMKMTSYLILLINNGIKEQILLFLRSETQLYEIYFN